MGQIIVYIYALEGYQFQKDFRETIVKVSLFITTSRGTDALWL